MIGMSCLISSLQEPPAKAIAATVSTSPVKAIQSCKSLLMLSFHITAVIAALTLIQPLDFTLPCHGLGHSPET